MLLIHKGKIFKVASVSNDHVLRKGDFYLSRNFLAGMTECAKVAAGVGLHVRDTRERFGFDCLGAAVEVIIDADILAQLRAALPKP